MKLTKKLLGLLNRVFDIDPERFLAFRLTYNGSMKWSVVDAVLTTEVVGGIGHGLKIDLTVYTLRELIEFLSQQPGYSVLAPASSERLALGARVLLDGEGNIAASNGDHLYGYASLTWAFYEPAAVELKAAKAQIPEALRQLSIPTASDGWLDELGNLYGVTRLQREDDDSFGPRIIAEVVRPRSNNVAMEAAISYYTGQKTKVTDAVIYGDTFPLYDKSITYNSQYRYQASAQPRYCLFDVQYGYDLLSSADPGEFAARVRMIIERIRAGGTQLRSLLLQAGALSDTLTPPTDDWGKLVVSPKLKDTLKAPTDEITSAALLSILNDAFIAPTDSQTIRLRYGYQYNSTRRRNSAIKYQSGMTVVE